VSTELQAIARAFRDSHNITGNPLRVASVKGNIGYVSSWRQFPPPPSAFALASPLLTAPSPVLMTSSCCDQSRRDCSWSIQLDQGGGDDQAPHLPTHGWPHTAQDRLLLEGSHACLSIYPRTSLPPSLPPSLLV
jgi:hypothetical protein